MVRGIRVQNAIKTYYFSEDQTVNYSVNDIDEVDPNETLMGRSRATSISSRDSRSERKSFKFKSCTICLSDFKQDDSVKCMPGCGHTFHSDCLAPWLQKRFRCPNCNLDINMGSEALRAEFD